MYAETEGVRAVCIMNLCMIQDGNDQVLVMDKVNDIYMGTIFPGSHVETLISDIKSGTWHGTGL